MHTDVISVTPDTPIEAAARLMLENKIGALPVMETEATSWPALSPRVTCFEVVAHLLGGNGPSTRSESRTCLAN